MLISAYSAATALKFLGGVQGGFAERSRNQGAWRGSESAFSTVAGMPTGARHPEAFFMAQDEGGLGWDLYVPTGSMTAAISGIGQMAVNSVAVASASFNGLLLASRSVNMTGIGAMTVGAASAYGNVRLTVRVGFQPSSDETADAVLGRTVDGTLTVKDTLSLLLAVATGKTTITNLGGGLATVRFRDVNDTKNRVTASMTDSARTSVTRDPT